jgi:hypothetical protein
MAPSWVPQVLPVSWERYCQLSLEPTEEPSPLSLVPTCTAAATAPATALPASATQHRHDVEQPMHKRQKPLTNQQSPPGTRCIDGTTKCERLSLHENPTLPETAAMIVSARDGRRSAGRTRRCRGGYSSAVCARSSHRAMVTAAAGRWALTPTRSRARCAGVSRPKMRGPSTSRRATRTNGCRSTALPSCASWTSIKGGAKQTSRS